MSTVMKVDHRQLVRLVEQIYASAGVPAEEALLVADSPVQADLWGHQSHGVMRTPWYYARLKSGAMKAVTQPETVIDGGAFAVFDGHDGVGQVLARHAMLDAVARAKKHGIGAVEVRNSNHFGTCMYYSKMAAERGCIAFLTTNGGPAMAPWGGIRKIIGTNPWSFAAPVGDRPPLLTDMATTGVARGQIYLARQRQETIPEGWALTADGAPTTDPAEAIAGIILPMAHHKGYAIAATMDMLAGVLSGSGFLSDVNGPYHADKPSRAGHFLFVPNIESFMPQAMFAERMIDFVTQLKAVPRAQGVDEIFYPGEMEARADTRNRADGVSLPLDTLDDVNRLARELTLQELVPL